MVVGREAELRTVGGLLAAARLGRGGTLVLVGEAGVGKSTLLREAAALAGGATLVRVVGTLAEREVPYAALGLVVGDPAAELAALPEPQGHALGAALALVEGDVPPPFAVGAATLGVLARRAETRPLVVLLDDAHLLDAASSRALAFAARRLADDPVLVLAAVRPDEPGPWTSSGFPELALGGLAADEVAALLADLGNPTSPEVAVRARAATGGNPLAVSELVRRPDAWARLAAGDPVPLPRDLVEVFSERARAEGVAVRLVVALAALAGGSAAVVAAAAADLGLPGDALARAERAGLVTLEGGTVEPSHPLVGSAVYSGLDPQDRRLLHAAVADALPPGRTDERAHHLAAAAAGPDESLASALEEVAAVAAGRGAPGEAAAGLERAAAITPDPARAADRLLRGAGHAWAAGDGRWAMRLGEDAAREAPSERWR
ncbi:AAA family ATPase, partial [Phycicoccus avicenniae]|uniref:AAA family ATPase n=1 Tax=Phycicoccus avicenniae TaxID=2828860 RepID=UPI003D2DE952